MHESEALPNWKPCPRPEHKTIEGRYVRLEPLYVEAHADGLFDASNVADAGDRFRWLYEYPPEDKASFVDWMVKVEASTDPLFFAVIDKASGTIGGRQTFMRIDGTNGSIEIGNIYWGPSIAGTRVATEALYLFAKHAFDDLGYRRFEWKCNNANTPSKRAATRFGFTAEGVFRQHLIVKGQNRDTAWFAMIDKDWPMIKAAFEAWLEPANFDEDGQQIRRLADIRGTAQIKA